MDRDRQWLAYSYTLDVHWMGEASGFGAAASHAVVAYIRRFGEYVSLLKEH